MDLNQDVNKATCGTASPFLTTLASLLIWQEGIPAGAFNMR
jgi:hypothetical protein